MLEKISKIRLADSLQQGDRGLELTRGLGVTIARCLCRVKVLSTDD